MFPDIPDVKKDNAPRKRRFLKKLAGARKFVYGAIVILAFLDAVFYFTYSTLIIKSADIADSPKATEPVSLKLNPRPKTVKAIYVTASTVRQARFQDLVALVKRTELNAMVIDVKDSSGIHLDDYLKKLVPMLHGQGIYLIARIVVFQDHLYAKSNPDVALKLANGSLWKDNKSNYWIDPSSKKVWDYEVGVSRQAIGYGFDELNYDYVRFPSEKTDSIVYPVYDGKKSQSQVIRSFWRYLAQNVKQYDPEIVLSADLFAFNMIDQGDLGIGQRFRDSLGVFDAVAPMVYPSHYSPGNFGFKNPAQYPYEVVYQSLMKGEGQIKTFASTTSTVIRPWLQDFDMGADYNAVMVRKEIKAVYDAGFESGWMLWNPNNVYTEGALLVR